MATSHPAGSGDVSRYAKLDDAADPAFFVDLMDQLREVPDFVALKRTMLEALRPAPGQRVLDVGCGPGDDVREIAVRLVPGGFAAGLDRSAVMIDEARRRSATVDLPVEFHTGDACSLPFPDNSFDACRAERTLVHVDDPNRAVAEMVRVTRPGGRLVVFEGHSAGAEIEGEDPQLMQTMAECFTRRLPNGWVADQLPAMCEAAGIVDLEIRSVELSMPYDCYHPMVKGLLESAVRTGEVDGADLARFSEAILRAEHEGRFAARGQGWLVMATVP